jgi:hypothetical protein
MPDGSTVTVAPAHALNSREEFGSDVSWCRWSAQIASSARSWSGGSIAAQSLLAIQHARLFSEIEEKSRQLAEASEHKSQFLASMAWATGCLTEMMVINAARFGTGKARNRCGAWMWHTFLYQSAEWLTL